jgi:hypothetical protein
MKSRVSGKRMREHKVQRAGSEKSVKKELALAAVGFIMIAGLIIQNGCASVKPVDQETAPRLTPEETAGIKIERIHPSVGGQMLDMRYRLVDVEKAKLAMNQKAQIYLIDQASGMKLPIPNMAKVGKLLQRPEKTEGDKVFWVFFSNPNALVKTGARVTLVIDEIRIKDIVVE